MKLNKLNHLKEFPKLKFNKKDISMIFFTSGSTGKSKGVKITQSGYIYSS